MKLFCGFYDLNSKMGLAWERSDGKRGATRFAPFFFKWPYSEDKLKVSDIEEAVRRLRKKSVKPNVVMTQNEADSLNEADKLNGIESEWKIGDEYFVMMAKI